MTSPNQAYEDWRKKAKELSLYACGEPYAAFPEMRCDRLAGHPGMHGVTATSETFFAIWAKSRYE